EQARFAVAEVERAPLPGTKIVDQLARRGARATHRLKAAVGILHGRIAWRAERTDEVIPRGINPTNTHVEPVQRVRKCRHVETLARLPRQDDVDGIAVPAD